MMLFHTICIEVGLSQPFFSLVIFFLPLPPSFPVNIHFKCKKPASFSADKLAVHTSFRCITDTCLLRCGADSKHSRNKYSREKRQRKPAICWAKNVVIIRAQVILKCYCEKASWLGKVRMAAFKPPTSSPCVLSPGCFLECKESAHRGQREPLFQIHFHPARILPLLSPPRGFSNSLFLGKLPVWWYFNTAAHLNYLGPLKSASTLVPLKTS